MAGPRKYFITPRISRAYYTRSALPFITIMFVSDLVDFLEDTDSDFLRLFRVLGIEFRLRHSRGVTLLLPKSADRKALVKKLDGKDAKAGCALKDQVLSLIIPSGVSVEVLEKLASAKKDVVTASRKAFEVAGKGAKLSVGGAGVKPLKMDFLRCDAEGSPVDSGYHVYELEKLPSGAKASESSMKDILATLDADVQGGAEISEAQVVAKMEELYEANNVQELKRLYGAVLASLAPQSPGESPSSSYKFAAASYSGEETADELAPLIYALFKIGAYRPTSNLVEVSQAVVSSLFAPNPNSSLHEEFCKNAAEHRGLFSSQEECDEVAKARAQFMEVRGSSSDVAALKAALKEYYSTLGSQANLDGEALSWVAGLKYDIAAAKEAAGRSQIWAFLKRFYACSNYEDLKMSAYLSDTENADPLGICAENVRLALQNWPLPEYKFSVSGGSEAPPQYLVEGGKAWLASGGDLDALVAALQ